MKNFPKCVAQCVPGYVALRDRERKVEKERETETERERGNF